MQLGHGRDGYVVPALPGVGDEGGGREILEDETLSHIGREGKIVDSREWTRKDGLS